MRKFPTDHKSNLDQSTVITLITMKLNCDDCYHVVIISTSLMTASKKKHNETFSQNLAKRMVIVIIIVANAHSFLFSFTEFEVLYLLRLRIPIKNGHIMGTVCGCDLSLFFILKS